MTRLLKRTRECPHDDCRHRNPRTATFCGRCGRPLAPPECESEGEATEHHKGWPWNVCLLTLVVIVAFVFLLPAVFVNHKPAAQSPSDDTVASVSKSEEPNANWNGTAVINRFDGLTLRVPDGWVYKAPTVNPRLPNLTPKAVFRLAPVEGDSENVYVRVTHFPGMGGPDETNLQRWYAMLQQPDGRSTREASTVERFEVGNVKVVLADIPGNMTVGGRTYAGWRMLGAIVKHEKGPHFVKVIGPTRSIDHWKASVVQYLKSAEVN